MPITLLLGGARSGKTSLAMELARRRDADNVTYIATAPTIDGDADLDARIARHRADRPEEWTTIEEELDLVAAAATTTQPIVIDCLTIWVSNLLRAGESDDEICAINRRTALTLAERPSSTIVVSNEVGMGVHPTTEIGRRYRDLLGRVNQEWAHVATTSLLMVAGKAVPLHDPWTFVEVER